MKKFFLHFILLLASQAMLHSQSETLVNKTWEHGFGAPNDYEWAASILDNAGNLITTGHTTIDATNTELLLIKQDPDGNVLWQQAFQTAANTKNGGIAISIDSYNSIYVAGVTSASGSLSNFDFLVIKYKYDGTKLWHQTFNGTGNGADVPTAIIANSTRVYVCGASKGSTTGMDYWALRLTASNGNLEWQNRYDYAGLDDVPANMAVDTSGNVVLTGSSAASSVNWEVATLKYAYSNGTALNTNRIPNTDSLGFSKPSAIAKDIYGNFIISGIKTSNGTDFDLRTIKLSSSLGVVWVQDYDSGAQIDSVSNIACDTSGGIVLTGWSSTPQQGSDILTLKYQSDGTFEWARKRTVNPQNLPSKGRTVALDANENIVIAGDMKGGSMVVTSYSPSGDIIWEKEIKDTNILSNRPIGLVVNPEGEIFLTSLARTLLGKSYSTHKINTLLRPLTPVLDTMDNPTHIEKEVIVRFKPDIIKETFIDNTDLRYGKIGDILRDTICLRDIKSELLASDFEDWVAVKVHRNMTTADSVATTRLGKIIKVPDFYNTMVLLVPDSYSELDEKEISDALEIVDLKCCVRFAGVNRTVELLECEPNDPLYPTQHNLNPEGGFPNANINVEQAWCDGATGNAGIKVAFIDTGARWTHEDFGDGTFSGSVITDGFNYFSNTPLSSDPGNDNVNGHGTKMTGIVAAIRNNAKGIAGIAGGEGSADGTNVIALRAVSGVTELSTTIEAFVDAVDEYEAQVINCSFGFNLFDNPDHSAEMREALHHANRMGVIVSAGRGNIGQSGGDTDLISPANEQEEWVLSVGGSNSSGNYSQVAKYGNVDVVAPAETSIVPTTSNTGDTDYTATSGTSAAAAHASGAIALLVGHALPTQLVQDDIKYLLQASAFDVDVPPAEPGVDDYTGSGRIDVGAAIAMIDKDHCVLAHFGTDTNFDVKDNELVEQDITLFLNDPFTNEDGQTFNEGSYTADVYKVTATVTNPIPPGSAITHYWERHSASTVFKHYETNPNTGSKFLLPVEHVAFVGTPDSPTTTLEGYVYFLKNSNCSLQGWIPASPEDAELTYTMIACDNVPTREAVAQTLKISPNPVSGELYISLPEGTSANQLLVEAFDMTGRRVLTQMMDGHLFNGEVVRLDTSKLTQGIFSVFLLTDKGLYSSKFIKI